MCSCDLTHYRDIFCSDKCSCLNSVTVLKDGTGEGSDCQDRAGPWEPGSFPQAPPDQGREEMVRTFP